MGLSHGTVKVMKDPEAQKEETAPNSKLRIGL
jgi:hypothetical protein